MKKWSRDKRFTSVISSIENGKAAVDRKFLERLRSKSLEEFETHFAIGDIKHNIKKHKWSRIMKTSVIRFTVSAAAVIAVAAFIFMTGKPTYAIENTVKAMSLVKTLRMEISGQRMTMRINQQSGLADHLRLESLDSSQVIITVPGQTYIHDKVNNEIKLMGQELVRNDLNFKDPVNSLIEQAGAVGGQVKISNVYSETAGREVVSLKLIRPDGSLAGEFLIDPVTSLPLYIGLTSGGGKLKYMGPIEYNVELAGDEFEFVIPDDAKITDLRPAELQN